MGGGATGDARNIPRSVHARVGALIRGFSNGRGQSKRGEKTHRRHHHREAQHTSCAPFSSLVPPLIACVQTVPVISAEALA